MMDRQGNFPHVLEEKNFDHPDFPTSAPLKEGMLKVSTLHSIYYAIYGNPKGIPVVVLHGGPGVGCSDSMSRFFDLNRWKVVMFDQRGAMRSTPFGCMEENTTQLLIEDIELLRKHLGIEAWLIFGGSWGSTLGILYGETYPERCLGFILRGIFLARKHDDLHLVYGMGKIFPEAYEAFIEFIPKEERGDLKKAYSRRIMNPDPKIHMPAAHAFMKFDLVCSTHVPNPEFINKQLSNNKAVMSMTKTFFHYANHDFFLKQNQVLSDLMKVSHLPAIIVHGRWDVITLPEMAYSLHRSWENSMLWMVPLGGHSTTESAIARALATATDRFADKLS
jgi:proline iminopeptidase